MHDFAKPPKPLWLTIVHTIILLVAICMLVRFGLGFAMFSLLTFASFAIVGKGNRLLWLLIFPFLISICAGIMDMMFTQAEKSQGSGNIVWGLTAFGLMPVLPAGILAIAHHIRMRRAARQT